MFELILIFLPILAADVINPVLLAAQIYAFGSKKPLLNSWLVLFGWFSVYFTSGVLLAIGLESIMEFLDNPRPIDFYIESIVAVLLIFFGLKMLLQKKKAGEEKDFGQADSLTGWGAFGIGASINLIGLPFAIPYFAAIDQLLKANFGWIDSLIALIIYNFLYLLPFIVLVLIRIILGTKSAGLFEKINGWMEKIGKVLLPGMMIALAIVLIVDAYLYFTTGNPCF